MKLIIQVISGFMVASTLMFSGCGGASDESTTTQSTLSEAEQNLVAKTLDFTDAGTLTYLHEDKKMYSFAQFSSGEYYYWDHMDGSWDYDEQTKELVLTFDSNEVVRFSDEGSYFKSLSEALPYDANVVIDTALMQKVIADFYTNPKPPTTPYGFTSSEVQGNWEISSEGKSSTVRFYSNGAIDEVGTLSGLTSYDVWRVANGKLYIEYYISGVKIEYRTVTQTGLDTQGCILADVIQSNSGYNRQWKMCKN